MDRHLRIATLTVLLTLGLTTLAAGATHAIEGPSGTWQLDADRTASPDCILDPSGPYLLPCYVCDQLPGPPFRDCF